MERQQNSFEGITEKSRLLIRRSLPQIKGFLDFRNWTYSQIEIAKNAKNSYTVTLLTQYYLLRFTEGPLRWVLWALLGATQPLMVTDLLDRVKKRNVALDPYLVGCSQDSVHFERDWDLKA